MFKSTLQSLLALSCFSILLVVGTLTAPNAGAKPMPTPTISAAPADDDATNGRDELYFPPCEDTEQPRDDCDRIVAIVQVELNGRFWEEAETACGDRYLVKNLTFGHPSDGLVQINGQVLYVCW